MKQEELEVFFMTIKMDEVYYIKARILMERPQAFQKR